MESAGKRVVMKVIRPWRDRHSTRERLVVDHVHLKRLLCGECNVIPDGVENDVGDRIKLTIEWPAFRRPWWWHKRKQRAGMQEIALR